MKKFIYIIIICLGFIYLLFTPKIISDKSIHDLSSNEFKETLIKAKQNDFNSLRKLYFYYHLKHKDIKSTCIVLCKITSTFEAVNKEEGDFKLYNDLNCTQKINCTKNSLDQLVEY